jgi:HEAT repeat protein
MTRARNKVMSKGLMGVFAAGAAGLLLLGAAALAGGMERTADGDRPGQAVRSEAKGAQEPLEAILKDLQNYGFAEGVGAPMRLRAHVQARKDDPRARREIEDGLLAFLRSDAWPGGKMEACRALRLIGSAAAVPVLEGMLADRETTDMARFALEYIPGEEADRALVAALEKTTGDLRRGIIASLGARGTVAAVGPLARLAAGKDAATALDAIRALGAIGTPEAAAALTAILGRSRGALAAEAASALLVCADRALGEGRKEAAAGIYEKVFSARVPTAARQAAFRGRIAAAGERGRDLVLKALAGKDATLYGPAIAMVPAVFDADGLGPVIGSMARLPAEAKIQLVAVLGGYRGEAVRAAVLEAVRSPLPQVRMEALRALGKVGDASVAGDLVSHAASSVGQEQYLAREVLSRLPGADVDGTVVERLAAEKDDAVRAELIRAVGSRRIAGAKPALVEAVKSAPPVVRARAAAP